MDKIERSTVIIIGNGPVGMMTSYCLAGNWPYWNGRRHPISSLDFHLRENQSFFEQSIERVAQLGEFIGGRSSSSVCNFYDCLTRSHESHHTNFIKWEFNPSKIIDHVVLGSDKPGGSWSRMENRSMKTVSVFNDIELPGMESEEWMRSQKCHNLQKSPTALCRPTIACASKYYSQYPSVVGIEEFQRPPFMVSCIQRVSLVENQRESEVESSELEWQVTGHYIDDGRQTVFRAPYLVLAIGRSHKKRKLIVDVINGTNCPILSSLCELSSSINLPVVIVGDGLQATEQILKCEQFGISVIHVYRKRTEEVLTTFDKFDPMTYPEYVHARDIISAKNVEDESWAYRGFDYSMVSSVDDGNVVCIKQMDDRGYTHVDACGILPCIGYDKDDFAHICGFDGLSLDGLTNESETHPKMFVLSSSTGNKFVRFSKLGVLPAVARIIEYENTKTNRV